MQQPEQDVLAVQPPVAGEREQQVLGLDVLGAETPRDVLPALDGGALDLPGLEAVGEPAQRDDGGQALGWSWGIAVLIGNTQCVAGTSWAGIGMARRRTP